MRSRHLLLLLGFAFSACTVVHSQSPTTVPAAAASSALPPHFTHFEKGQSAIHSLFLADQAAFLAGPDAIYIRTSDNLHWRAIAALVSHKYRQIAGGDRNHLFLLEPNNDDDQTQSLLEWNAATGVLTSLGNLPGNLTCRFLHDRGAYIDRDSMHQSGAIHLTTNGGRSWTLQKNPLGPKEAPNFLFWLDTNHLAIAGSETIAAFTVDAAANLTPFWSMARAGIIAPPRNEMSPLWFNAGRDAVEIDPATGKIVATARSTFAFNVAAQVGQELWLAGNRNAAVYRAAPDGKWNLIKKFPYPGPPSSYSGNGSSLIPNPPAGWVAYILATPDGRALLLGIDGQVYRWDHHSAILTAVPLDIDDTAVINAQVAAAATQPTDGQFKQWLRLFSQLPENQEGDILAAAKKKQEVEHLNNRQRVAWEIQECRNRLDENARHPPAPLATGSFDTTVFGLRFFSKTSGIAVTSLGILTTDGGPDRWKGAAGWTAPHRWIFFAGGDENRIFLITLDSREVIVKEGDDRPPAMEHDTTLKQVTRHGKKMLAREISTFTLWNWTKAAGITELRKLPRGIDYSTTPAPCDFATGSIGAFADGKTLMVTLDAGKSWIQSPLTLPKYADGVAQILFCGDDQLAIAAGDSISLLHLDETGHVHPIWSKTIEGPGIDGEHTMAWDSQNATLWLCSGNGDGIEPEIGAVRLTDGKITHQFNPCKKGESLESFSVAQGRMFAFLLGKGFSLRIFDLTKDPPAAVSEIRSKGSAISDAYSVPGASDLYLLLGHEILIEWNHQPVIPTFLTSDIHRAAVDNKALYDAEEKWPPGDEPSRHEAAAYTAAIHALTPNEMSQLIRESAAKADQFDNQRDQTLWSTHRAQEIKAAARPNPNP